jgi:hypothetical protein
VNKILQKDLPQFTVSTVRITSKDGKMSKEEVKRFYEGYTKRKGENFLMRGLGPTRWFTLATPDKGLELEVYTDNFCGTVKDECKIDEFTQLDLTFLTKKK